MEEKEEDPIWLSNFFLRTLFLWRLYLRTFFYACACFY